MKQETIGIIFNEKGRGLGGGGEERESILNWDISTTLLPPPAPIPLPPKYSMTVIWLIWSNQKFQ